MSKRDYVKRQLKSNPFFKSKRSIRKIIWKSFNKRNWTKRSKTYEYVGCNHKTFIKHIESQFTDGMTWDNHGWGDDCWHYDHYYPVSLAKTPEDLYIFHNYTNFRPLWEKDNFDKSDIIPPGFDEWYKMMKEKIHGDTND